MSVVKFWAALNVFRPVITYKLLPDRDILGRSSKPFKMGWLRKVFPPPFHRTSRIIVSALMSSNSLNIRAAMAEIFSEVSSRTALYWK